MIGRMLIIMGSEEDWLINNELTGYDCCVAAVAYYQIIN